MKTLPVGEFKSHFSEIIGKVKKGEEIVISYGKKKEKVAVLIPYLKYANKSKRKLGILEHKASFVINADFKITDDELLNL